MTMNRATMAKQTTEGTMKKGSKTKPASKKTFAKGGMVDQTQCSPRKQAAMKGM